jgi:hypothetical protein
MDTIQKSFERLMKERFSFPIIGALLIKRRLEKKGVLLNKDQMDELEKKLRNISSGKDNFDFDLDNEQNEILGITDSSKIKIDLSDPEKDLDDIYQAFFAKLGIKIPGIVDEVASQILPILRKNAPAMLRERRKEIKGFEHRLNADWKKPFDLFETFLAIAFELGDGLNKEFRKEKSEKGNYVLEVLTRLHARSCQIASEILVLLESGFADGALARWRSLHEIAVVGSFIKAHGNEVAERYLLHDNIESFKAANLYRKHYEALGETPIPQNEYDSIEAVHENLIARFGKSYKNEYGWASSALNIERPTFCNIEENVGLDHYRPYYKLASHNVHANPKGVMFKLGLLGNIQDILLAGPSNIGFTDPAQFAAISLGIITIDLLLTKPTIDSLVASQILLKFESEIGKEFFTVEKEIEERERFQRERPSGDLDFAGVQSKTP